VSYYWASVVSVLEEVTSIKILGTVILRHHIYFFNVYLKIILSSVARL
jgi:hypothetical protein